MAFTLKIDEDATFEHFAFHKDGRLGVVFEPRPKNMPELTINDLPKEGQDATADAKEYIDTALAKAVAEVAEPVKEIEK